MDRNGRPVVFRRIIGFAPNATTVSAHVLAIVTGAVADVVSTAKGGYGEKESGAISQTDRTVMVLESDLAAEGFPLPVQKNDTVVLADGAGPRLNIIQVDDQTRHLAGAIELRAASVA